MRIVALGSAAGGGFPQWNCACRNCRAVRAGNFPGKARSQAQVAVSHDGESWFLLGASIVGRVVRMLFDIGAACSIPAIKIFFC